MSYGDYEDAKALLTRYRVGNVKSLRSLGSRSLLELRGERCCGRPESSSSGGSDGGIIVRRSFEVDSLQVGDEAL